MHALVFLAHLVVVGGFTQGASSATGASPLTTKGDLYTFSTVDDRLGIGADGLCLKPKAANATGLEWGTCAAATFGYAEAAAASLGGF